MPPLFMNKSKLIPPFLLIVFLALGGCEEDIIPDLEDARDAFIGTWTCTDYPGKSQSSAYTVEITADTYNSSRVLIYNYFQLGYEVAPYAVVAGNTITVPEQLVENGTWQVSGFGQLKGNEIHWQEYNANHFTYKAVFRRSK